MGLQKNVLFNLILTVSNYIVPLFVFPYVSRVLGVENFGTYNYIDNLINYFILFSMMGISTIGIREIAMSNSDLPKQKIVYSSLITLNAISTLIVISVLFVLIAFTKVFENNENLFIIGIAKILFNFLLVEWFFIGKQNFKFIAIRSIIIRILYVVLIFIFVRKRSDYDIYYYLTVISVILNGLINFISATKFVGFSLKMVDIRRYLKPFFSFGIYTILTAMYTTFNVVYLGIVTNNREVGLFSTAMKIQMIMIALYTAYSTVMMPHISAILGKTNCIDDKIKSLIGKSFEILFSFGIPLVYVGVFLAPEIIEMAAGSSYIDAVTTMRIVMPLIIIIGLEQISVIQILTPLKRDRFILHLSLIGAITGMATNFLLVRSLGSEGSAISWVISEFVVLILSFLYLNKKMDFKFNNLILLKHLIFGIPYIFFCLTTKTLFNNIFVVLSMTLLFSFIYFIIIQFFVFKNIDITKLKRL